jgi:hypothetical protein
MELQFALNYLFASCSLLRHGAKNKTKQNNQRACVRWGGGRKKKHRFVCGVLKLPMPRNAKKRDKTFSQKKRSLSNSNSVFLLDASAEGGGGARNKK